VDRAVRRVGLEVLTRIAKSARKYWCGITTVTQDVGDVLASGLGRAVLNNAATKVLLQQSSEFIGDVAETFRLSEKKTEAAFKISLARFSSFTSRSRSGSRLRSSVVSPGARPASRLR
jgi:type IV secretory pathway VirB4 component